MALLQPLGTNGLAWWGGRSVASLETCTTHKQWQFRPLCLFFSAYFYDRWMGFHREKIRWLRHPKSQRNWSPVYCCRSTGQQSSYPQGSAATRPTALVSALLQVLVQRARLTMRESPMLRFELWKVALRSGTAPGLEQLKWIRKRVDPKADLLRHRI